MRRNTVVMVAVSIVLVYLLDAHILMASGSKATEQSKWNDILSDPIFGIDYRPSEIRFEVAPPAVYKCSNLEARRGNLFLFGHVIRNKVHFYYVYGWIEVQLEDGTRVFEAESDSGIIVIVSPQGCREIGAGYAWSPGKKERQEAEKYGITEAIASSLLTDGVDREVQAFGGRENFFRKLKEADIDEATLPAPVRARLEVLRAYRFK